MNSLNLFGQMKNRKKCFCLVSKNQKIIKKIDEDQKCRFDGADQESLSNAIFIFNFFM